MVALAVAASTAALTSQSATAATVTLWKSEKPAVAGWADSSAIELGVRFRSSKAGYVTGVRMFKGAKNTGRHVGSLWSADGKRLARAVFIRETKQGWQRVQFSKPVRVHANRTYVASYHTTTGHYAVTRKYFAEPRHRKSLKAVRGVFNYGPKSAFPTHSYQATNYWVDVSFRTTKPTATKSQQVPNPVTSAPASTTPAGSVSYGWQLTAGNTGLAGAGVDRNTLPVYNGSITSGQTLSMVQITKPINVSALRDVTFDRVWIHPSSGTETLMLGNSNNITVKDSDLDGPAAGSDASSVVVRGYNPTGYKLQRLHVTGGSIGVWIDGNGTGTMDDTYVHAQRSSGSHVDGFTRRTGTGTFTVNRSRIDANVIGSTTGAFFLQDTDGRPIAGITVKDTLLEGIGYVITLENRSGAGTAVGMNNVRVRLSRPNYYGNLTTVGSIAYTDWTNVREYDPSKGPGAEGPLVRRR